jgi:Metallo-beta-lactamase superfamily
MSRFKALPVHQGDCFVLAREGRTIVVDGGGNRSGIVPLLRANGIQKRIDVLVCTHSDADHASGVAGILDSGQITVGEVWLPWGWLNRLDDLLRNSDTFLKELLHDWAVERLPYREQATDRRSIDSPRAPLGEYPSGGLNTESVEGNASGTLGQIWRFLRPPRSARERLFLQAARSALLIRAIVVTARRKRIPIRWFDFEAFIASGKASGGKPFLRPLNAIERLPQASLAAISAAEYLSLTLENKRSLVFLAPESAPHSAVLLAADSDLNFAFAIAGTSERVLSTVPHHGARANAVAYGRVQQAVGGRKVLWIRSDGRYKYRPCPAFLALRNRACTSCRNPSALRQVVRASDRGGWKLSRGVLSCTCI